MKYENANYVSNLLLKVKRLESARVELTSAVNRHDTDLNHWDVGGPRGLFQLGINQYRDGSGINVDLSGCAVGIKVLKFTLKTVEEEIAAIVKELETL